MSDLMDDLESVRSYLGSLISITLGSFEYHLAKVEEVMKQFQSARLKFKIDKCKLSVPKLEYLGYIITQEGIKLDPKTPKQLSILNSLRIKIGEAFHRYGTIIL